MDSEQGHIQLDRAVATITVGARHRSDLGDITTLAESIERQGLLQPITLTPDGVLVRARVPAVAVARFERFALNGHH